MFFLKAGEDDYLSTVFVPRAGDRLADARRVFSTRSPAREHGALITAAAAGHVSITGAACRVPRINPEEPGLPWLRADWSLARRPCCQRWFWHEFRPGALPCPQRSLGSEIKYTRPGPARATVGQLAVLRK